MELSKAISEKKRPLYNTAYLPPLEGGSGENLSRKSPKASAMQGQELWPVGEKLRSSLFSFLFVLTALIVWPAVARADKIVEATKIITWSFDALPAVGALGIYKWDLFASAQDNHVGLLPLENKGAANWGMRAGLPNAPKTSGLAGGPPGVEPDAKADIAFQAGAPVAVGGISQVTGTIHIKVKADTVPETKPPAHGAQSAVATASGSMTMKGGVVSGVVVKQPGKALVVVPAAKFEKGTVGFGAGTGRGAWHDPFSVMLFDLTAGSSITEELFTLDIQGVVDGEWSWDANGLSLNVPLDGVSSASMGLNVMSSWIADPKLVDSTVSLANGVFSTTGIFAGLPWNVTPTSATLPAGVLDFIQVPYLVPAGLINDSHLYESSLTTDAFAHVEAAVPEPTTLVLLFTGIMSLIGGRWWFKQRVI